MLRPFRSHAYPASPYRPESSARSERSAPSTRYPPTTTNGGGSRSTATPSYASPRSQLPGISTLEDPSAKQRWAGGPLPMDGGGATGGLPPHSLATSPRVPKPPTSSHPAYAPRESAEDEYQRPIAAARGGSYTFDRRPPSPPPTSRHEERGQLVHRSSLPLTSEEYRSRVAAETSSVDQEGCDTSGSSSTLARRRGDAAHAKASRLHINTGNNHTDRGGHPGDERGGFAGSSSFRTSADAGLVARSAPPTKVSFEGSDIRSHYYPDSISRGAVAGAAAQQPPSPSQNRVGPQQSGYPPHTMTSGGGQEGIPSSRSVQPLDGHASSARGGPYPSYPGPTPVTSRFVPQTATLPSPAYHTTRFAQNGGGPSHSSNSMAAPGSLPLPRTNNNSYPPSGGSSQIPSTSTRLIPDHLRSPPSSKDHFLSLFSNFYDSLSDSRTLKLTLEDQVRRCNTLLTTLSKTTNVLEATVERKLKEERVIWRGEVEGLREENGRLRKRMRLLEEKVGITDDEDEMEGDTSMRDQEEEQVQEQPALKTQEAAGRQEQEEGEEEEADGGPYSQSDGDKEGKGLKATE